MLLERRGFRGASHSLPALLSPQERVLPESLRTGSFSSPLCSIETRVFVGVLFFSHGVLDSPPRKAGLSQLLSRLWVFALSSSLQVFPDHSRQRLGQVEEAFLSGIGTPAL